MKKNAFLKIVVLCGLLSIGLVGIAVASKAVDDGPPAIMVSPSTIVLAKVSIITVHTNISAATVVPGSIDLNGVAPIGVGVDDLGDIVAKFSVADLALQPGQATLTLSGALIDDGGFSASDVVTVK